MGLDGSEGLIRVRMDDRERNAVAALALAGNPETLCEWTRLRTGDYQVGNLVVERKTLADFAASIVDGRLFRQAERLAACERSLLILEGPPSDLPAVGLRREALQGALLTLSLIYNIPVLRAQDGHETARLVLLAARQLRRHATGALRPGRRPQGKRAVQMGLVQALPRVGPKRAATLLARYPTVREVVCANLEDLESLPGFGPTTARGVLWAVREGRSG